MALAAKYLRRSRNDAGEGADRSGGKKRRQYVSHILISSSWIAGGRPRIPAGHGARPVRRPNFNAERDSLFPPAQDSRPARNELNLPCPSRFPLRRRAVNHEPRGFSFHRRTAMSPKIRRRIARRCLSHSGERGGHAATWALRLRRTERRGRGAGKARDGDIVSTLIPARLERLPWGRFHVLVVAALGITWILDGLEVTLAGSVAGALKSSPRCASPTPRSASPAAPICSAPSSARCSSAG